VRGSRPPSISGISSSTISRRILSRPESPPWKTASYTWRRSSPGCGLRRADMEQKICSECGAVKLRSDFHRSSSRRDGLQVVCKSCHVARNRRSSLAHPETRKARLPLQDFEKERARLAAWKKRNRKKVLAHKAVNRAVRSGRIERPTCCSRCGSDRRRIEAHHEDYDAQLDVIWLCSACHGQRHLELGAST
jgi:hypothetical protein